jgi:hypothetical protein
MLLPVSVAIAFGLDIQPLPTPFTIYFAAKNTYASITRGVRRDPKYVWDFIAVSESIDVILVDFKQAARKRFVLIADMNGASLCSPEYPPKTVIWGPVRSNGSYEWPLRLILDLQVDSPTWHLHTRQANLLAPWTTLPTRPIVTHAYMLRGARPPNRGASSIRGIGYQPDPIDASGLIHIHSQNTNGSSGASNHHIQPKVGSNLVPGFAPEQHGYVASVSESAFRNTDLLSVNRK